MILKAARDHSVKLTNELMCLFVESDSTRYEHLLEVLERIKPSLPELVSFRALRGTFNDHSAHIFSEVEKQNERRAPMLAFVDPFGSSQVPFSSIERLMKYPKCEVLINFMYEETNRPNFAEKFDALFGSAEWREAVDIPEPVERLRIIKRPTYRIFWFAI